MIALLAATVCVAAAGCTTASHHAKPPRPAVPTGPGGTATPRPSTVAAVQALLSAEQRGDHGASFALLSDTSRQAYPDVDAWAKHRSQLPALTGFQVAASPNPDEAFATVQHHPGLDPLVGLSPSEERERWQGYRVPGGWLVGADPEVRLVFPSDQNARDTAVAWASAVQRCDQAAAGRLQAVAVLFVTGDPPALCGTAGPFSAGTLTRLPPGPTSKDIVAQYGDPALGWARAVELTGAAPVHVIVAPIGADWRVVGLYP